MENVEKALPCAESAPVEEEESTLLKEYNALRLDKKEIKGRLADLSFDNLDDAALAKAQAKVYQDHDDMEKRYLEKLERTKTEIASLKQQMAEKKAKYKVEVARIKTEETNATPEEIAQAKITFEEAKVVENHAFLDKKSELESKILAIRREERETAQQIKAEFKKVRSTPMKRADKEEKLDLIKAESYNNAGHADIEVMVLRNELAKLTKEHKATLAELTNEFRLKKSRIHTMIKNARKSFRTCQNNLKSKELVLSEDYAAVAPIHYRLGAEARRIGIDFVEKQKVSFSSWKGFTEWLIHNAVYLIILALCVVTAIAMPSWISFDTLIAIVKHTSALLPLALGVAGTIVLTGTDLSLGRVWGLTALVAAVLLGYSSTNGMLAAWTGSMPWIWIIVVLFIVMGVGAFFGGINGFFVAKFSIHPFIVTLATQLIVYGIILLFGQVAGFTVTFSKSNFISDSYNQLINGGFRVGNTTFEWYNIYALILLFIIWFIWNKTKFGKSMFAVGCNPEAAAVSGINVQKTIIMTFMLAGLCYGIGGFQYNPINGGAQLSTGAGGELDPITAAVIGGVSFTGGIGKVSGVLVGCLLLKVIDSCLLTLGASTAYINIVKGAIILLAVALDMKKYIVKK